MSPIINIRYPNETVEVSGLYAVVDHDGVNTGATQVCFKDGTFPPLDIMAGEFGYVLEAVAF